MRAIGFATKFYTLWDVVTEDMYTTFGHKHYKTGVKTTCFYIKNISMDLDKVKELYPDVPIWEDLRGINMREYSFTKKVELPYDLFQDGWCKGDLIANSENLKALFEVYTRNAYNGRSRVLARRRLIELGKLVRFDNYIDYDHRYYAESDSIITCVVKRSYCHPWEKEKIERERSREIQIKQSKYLHNEGDKVEINIKEVARTGFDGAYGYTHIITYLSDNGDTYIYKGGSPFQNIEDSGKQVKVRATIKHSDYRGMKQTLIQRVKILS